MRKKISNEVYSFFQRNFWGITLASVSVISLIFILLFGFGPFILLVLFGILGFLVGNSVDRGVSFFQSFKDFIKLFNSKLKEIVGKGKEDV